MKKIIVEWLLKRIDFEEAVRKKIESWTLYQWTALENSNLVLQDDMWTRLEIHEKTFKAIDDEFQEVYKRIKELKSNE